MLEHSKKVETCLCLLTVYEIMTKSRNFLVTENKNKTKKTNQKQPKKETFSLNGFCSILKVAILATDVISFEYIPKLYFAGCILWKRKKSQGRTPSLLMCTVKP